ncbi:MAG TPA: rhamnogalacturonan lyase B N-terminal domain-containing protein [Abditibacteriaceae bacterium]
MSLLLPSKAYAAFGLTADSNFYTVDTGGGLVFKVRRTDNGSSTHSAGDIASLFYNGVEYQNQLRGSQVNGGFDYLYNGVTAVTVSAAIVATDYVKVTVEAGNLTHYYMARRGYPHIYMGTYFTTEPDTLGLCRYIVRIPSDKLPNGPTPSDIRNNTGAIEASDIFRLANGETRSKHYSNQRLIDWDYIGATGNNVGVWMVRDNNEGGSSGPFYRSLLNQCGSDQEITYIINYGEAQTEPFRVGVFNGPYVLTFTNGAPPSAIDTSWIHSSGIDATLRGWVQNRGRVAGQASGIPAGFEGVVGFANTTAQYWCKVNNGSFTSPWMIPGDYTMKLYKGELAVATDTVTVPQSVTPVPKNIASTEITPLQRWRIGEWDGKPTEFLNGDKVTTMHPSDVRMAPWGPITYTVGTDSPSRFPCYQWKSVNNPTTIKFDLTADQLTAHTLRVGLTCAFAGARPQVNVNNWTSPIPSPSTQPTSRTLTVGTYRGNNVTFTYNIPASAFVVGTNTLTLYVVSGSSGNGFLSPGYSYDCVELDAQFNGAYRLTPRHAQDKALNVEGANPNNGAQIEISTYQGATEQQFLIDPQSDGTYRIRTVLAGNRCVELPFGATDNGTLVKLWDDNGNDAQRWSLVPVVGDWYKIVPKNNAAKCMDVLGGPDANADGSDVGLWDYFGNYNQMWRLTPISDDVFVEFSANSYTVNEDGAQATITVTRTGNLSLPVSINYATIDGTEAQSGDYSATSGTLNFAANESSKTFGVTITNDNFDEGSERINLTLSNPQNGAILRGRVTATLTITDDDVSGTTVAPATGLTTTEAGGTTTFTVRVLSQPTSDVSIALASSDTSEGIVAPTNLTFTADNWTIPQTVTVTGVADDLEDGDVNYRIITSPAVSEDTFYQGLDSFDPTVTNLNRSAPLPTISVSDAPAAVEGSAAAPRSSTFMVTLSVPTTKIVTVNYATENGSALQTGDYVGASGTLSFAPHETTKTVTVTLKGDSLNEASETFKVNLSEAVNATIDDAQGIGSITDDDRAPSLLINDVAVQEGNSGTSSATFTITLSTVSGQTVTVNAITANGIARSPGDYIATGVRFTFAPGEISKTFSVPVVGDLLDESNEIFYALLSSPVNAGIARGRGVATITDNDAAPSIIIEDLSIGEGNGATRLAVFRLRLSAPSGQGVKASYVTASSAIKAATAGSDYQAVALTETTFNVGQTVALARVVINGDVLHEPDETFLVNLSNPVNATISDNQAIGTILNDDRTPSLTINDVSVSEENSGTKTLHFVVTLNGATAQTVTVNYATANGVARAPDDYLSRNGTLSFTPGSPSTQTISVTVNGDVQVEGDETLFVLLSGAVNATISRARGTGTITNDDSSG